MVYTRCFALCVIVLLASLVAAQSPDESQPPLAYFLYDDDLEVNALSVWRFNSETRQSRRLAPSPDSSFTDDLQWSPDGESISYDADPGLLLMRADGSEARTLIDNVMMYNWAPDSQSVVYVKYDSDTRRYTIYSRAIDDPVEHLRFQDASWPAWSPDGTTLAYASSKTMTLSLFHKGQSTTIVNGIGDLHGEIERPQWSPDGTKLAFGVVETTRADTPTGTISLYTINADGSGLTQVASDIHRPELDFFTSFYFGWTSFDWSPDSTTLVYSSGFETIGLYTVKADGTDHQTLITGEVQANGQAVPGQFFEFQSVDWSPDGTLIALSAKRFTSFDIFTIRPDGTDLRPLIATEQDEIGAVWRPDVP